MDRGFNNFSNPASVSGGRPFGGYQMPQSNPSITHQGVGSSHVPVIKNYNNMNKELQKSLENAARVEKELSRQNPGAQLQQIYGNENVISGDLNPVTDHIKQVVNWNQKLSRKNLKHAKVIDLSYKSLDGNLDEFCKVMDCSDFDLSLLSFSSTSLNDKNLEDVIEAVRGGKGVYYNNPPNGERHLCSGAVFGERQFKLSPDDPFFLQQKITYLNLSNCNLTDASADMIASSLTYGHFHNHPIQARYLTNTKVIDVSGNNITAKGEGLIAKAMQSQGVQNIIIKTQELKMTAHLIPFIGSKDQKIAAYKHYIQKGKDAGVYNENIVVDKSWSGAIKRQFEIAEKAGIAGTWGFVKCMYNPKDMATGYAKGKIVAQLPTKVSKSINIYDTIDGVLSCYLGATNDVWTSEAGLANLKNELCVMGETEFCE